MVATDKDGNPISVKVGPKTYGSFQNVTHKVSLDEGYDKLCKRNITGEITFDWPEPSTYVDVVFIQDFSGSFEGTIATVGTEIKNMVNSLNFGTDIDGSPKDRAMIVTYQGSQGGAFISGSGTATYNTGSNYDYGYKIQDTGLSTNAKEITDWVTTNYTSTKVAGATPTVDGMVEAKKRYEAATPNTANYNKATYKVTNGTTTYDRQRKTVYILITDGAANTAKWNNLPTESQNLLNISSAYKPGATGNVIPGTNYVRYDNVDYKYGRYYEIYNGYYYGPYTGYYKPSGYTYSSTPVGTQGPSGSGYYAVPTGGTTYWFTDYTTYKGGDANLSYVWSDERENPDGAFYYPNYLRTEAYKVMLDAQKRLASGIRTTGGVGQSAATFVSAFWEDRTSSGRIDGTNGGYGSGYDTYMKPKIDAALLDMAGGNNDFFITSSNIQDFTSRLTKAFKKAAASVLDNVTIASTLGVDTNASNYTLQRKDATATGGWVTVKPGAQTVTDPQKLYLDFEDMKPGSYKITYHMSESEYKGYTDTNKTFNPVNLTMTFEGKDVAIGSIEGEDLPYLSTNTKTDCEISLNKIITEDKEDYDRGGTNYKELKKRRDYFYFDTKYTFTDKLQDAKDTLVIQDKIDPNLDIVDVFLIAGNTAAEADAISGATPNNTQTLIAEMGEGSESGDLTNVPNVTISTDNVITYTLPEKPGTIGTQTFPYGGYVGKDYVLVVKVKIKEGVSDALIEAMREPIGGDQAGMKGIPNTSELLIDGKATMSNTVRAVPPVFQEPNIAKQIQKTNAGEYWSDYSAILDNAQEAYNYRIRLDMPFDTTTYETLVISDTLDETIGKTDGDNIKVYYVDPNTGDRTDLTLPAVSIDYNSASGNHTLSVTIEDPAIFSTLSEKQLFVEFPVKVKDNADLSKKYDDISKTLQIHNISSYKINDKYVKESNKVTAIIPLPNVSLNKVEKISDTENKPLSGAKFTLTDITGGEPGVEVSTTLSGGDGLVKFENLIPGRTYTIKETGAPSGYLPVNKTWTLTVDKQNKVTIKDNATGDAIVTSPFDVENTKPETPQPEKLVKVSTAADDTYKKHEGTTADPALKLSKLEEEVTYKVQVPIGSTEAFTELTFFDQMDTLLVPDPNTFKVYTAEDPNTKVEGVGGISNGEITYSITQNIDQLKDKTLVFEFKAKVGVDLEEVFKKYPDGIIPNKADFAVNGTPKTTNETKIQVSKGSVSLAKFIADDTNNTNRVPLPEGITAGFNLYKVVGAIDTYESGALKPDTVNTPDELVQSVTVTGPNKTIIDNLDTGTYYLIETSAPIGYAKESGIFGEFTIPGTGGTITATDVEATNIKAETPTISKQIRSTTNTERLAYSGETLPIGIGEVWEYAVDIKMPATPDNTFEYTVIDNVPSIFDVKSIEFLVSTKDANGDYGPFTPNHGIADNFYKPVGTPPNPNAIKLVVPANIDLSDFADAIIRIQVKTSVKPGTNLMEATYTDADGNIKYFMEPDGTIPNTATLSYGDHSENSTVRIKPTILRNLNFTKKLGLGILGGAEFALYKVNKADDGTTSVDINPALNPFTNQPYRASSNSVTGKISFANVPAGTYVLKETLRPAGTVPLYDYVEVIVSNDASLKDGDPGAVIFKTPDGNIITDTENLINNRPVQRGGSKTWTGDDDNSKDTRPQEITVRLFRKIGLNGIEEEVNSAKVTVDSTAYQNLPWSYLFKVDKFNKTLMQYAPSGEEYIYYVKEDPIPNYDLVPKQDNPVTTDVDESLSMDLENQLRFTPFAIIKKDGDTNQPIEGTTFTLWDKNNNVIGDYESDKNGFINFGELSNGTIYYISEKQTEVSEDYIVNSGTVQVNVEKDGAINLIPNRFNKAKVTDSTGTETGQEGYVFYNYKEPIPEKKLEEPMKL
ncbi:SpaA isopeptide-forming pilin-related protein [Microaceticoccus formicicus]|uniref:SpaA isopeptide-forming pilin-related protein n=1 Tax=Microaceticoccus formicicus TaxID=3118105 RepID=UPI003CD032AA|nr:SpaA isopeptide-forming pilin-related protein [Peptoniphilaceae bacterium AMB_02]